MCGSARNEKKKNDPVGGDGGNESNGMLGQPLFIIQNISYCLLFQVFSPSATQRQCLPLFSLLRTFPRKKNCIEIINWGFVIVRDRGRKREKWSQVADKLCDLHQNDNNHFLIKSRCSFRRRRRRMSEKKKPTRNGTTEKNDIWMQKKYVFRCFFLFCWLVGSVSLFDCIQKAETTEETNLMKMVVQFYSTVKMIIFFNSHKQRFSAWDTCDGCCIKRMNVLAYSAGIIIIIPKYLDIFFRVRLLLLLLLCSFVVGWES